jgi:tetratricopeptide (TPR) repeat protein
MEKARSALDGEQERELSRILVSWGDRASRQGEWEQAVRWYENALLINQQNPRAWCQLGQVQVALGDLERAKDALQYAVELDDPLCVRPYGMVFYEQGAYDRAIQIWSEALESYPDHKERKEWYLDIAFTWLKVEDWQKVLDVVEQGRAEFPEESRFYYQRGLALYEGFGQTEAALADFKKAIAMNVGNAAPYRALGDLYIQEGQYPEAASWYAQAVRRDPGNLVWYLSWADAALGAGDMDQAIQAYQAARERFPTHQRILYQLADLYHRAGQLPEAAAVIEEALTFADQDQVDMYLLAGAIFEAQGNKPAARDAYEQVLRVEPQNQTALEGLSRIED